MSPKPNSGSGFWLSFDSNLDSVRSQKQKKVNQKARTWANPSSKQLPTRQPLHPDSVMALMAVMAPMSPLAQALLGPGVMAGLRFLRENGCRPLKIMNHSAVAAEIWGGLLVRPLGSEGRTGNPTHRQTSSDGYAEPQWCQKIIERSVINPINPIDPIDHDLWSSLGFRVLLYSSTHQQRTSHQQARPTWVVLVEGGPHDANPPWLSATLNNRKVMGVGQKLKAITEMCIPFCKWVTTHNMPCIWCTIWFLTTL